MTFSAPLVDAVVVVAVVVVVVIDYTLIATHQ